MAFKITETHVHVEDAAACYHGLQNEIVAMLDTEDDLESLGTNWYPLSTAIIAEPYGVKILSASHEWVDVESGNKPEEETTVELMFTEGEQVVTPTSGSVFSKVTINQPGNLISENIKKNVNIAGMTGSLEERLPEETQSVPLSMASGNQVIQPTADKVLTEVTVQKPSTLVPENVKKDIDIGGVVGSFEGGGGASDVAVRFFGYNGEVVEEWDRTAVASKAALPNNPTHTGLIAQGWNWDLQHIKDYVAAYDGCVVNVGQMFKTASGLTEIDITITKVTNPSDLTVVCNMVGNKDWGDGTEDNLTSHTYAAYGSYTITCDGTSIPAGSMSVSGGMFGSTNSNMNRYWCTAIRIGVNVTTIGGSAFYNCQTLKNVTIPQGVTSIGTHAFRACYLLASVTIPQGVTIINGFYECQTLKNASIPQGVTRIEDNAFYKCVSLTSVTIPQGVTYIGIYALYNCDSLRSVIFPQGITSFRGSVFYYCASLESVTFHQGITNFGEQTFYGCSALKSVTIPQSVTSIPNYVFYECQTLKNVTIPKGVTSIGNSAFNNCYSITEYDFTQATSVPTLSNVNAFSKINGLCKILVPASLESSWKAATNWATYADYIYGV